jgi:hypothetical protein
LHAQQNNKYAQRNNEFPSRNSKQPERNHVQVNYNGLQLAITVKLRRLRQYRLRWSNIEEKPNASRLRHHAASAK